MSRLRQKFRCPTRSRKMGEAAVDHGIESKLGISMKNELAKRVRVDLGRDTVIPKPLWLPVQQPPTGPARNGCSITSQIGHVYDGTSFSCPMLANPHHHRNETEQKKYHKHQR
jgi:hypothetical protein